jgi:hypothetical protein
MPAPRLITALRFEFLRITLSNTRRRSVVTRGDWKFFRHPRGGLERIPTLFAPILKRELWRYGNLAVTAIAFKNPKQDEGFRHFTTLLRIVRTFGYD